MTTVFASTDTPAGPFGWLRGPRGILASGWVDDPDYLANLARVDPVTVEPGEDPATVQAISEFFAGQVDALDRVLVDQSGGPFIEATWHALRAIAPGETLSYTELAAAAGRPAAVRAAASACATNRTALFVPCHRVLRSDGSLGGFRYGTQVKAALLDFERGLAVG